jgi:hypothetical protein
MKARIEGMREPIAQRDWRRLERSYADACRAAAPDVESAVSEIDLSSYTDSLRSVVDRLAVELDGAAVAVYWEFDVDNRWSSAFYPCSSYRPESHGDDDWASDFQEDGVVAGPDMAGLAELAPKSWDGSDRDAAINAYLVARTVASFGRAAEGWRDTRPLCAGYHDQWIVFRIAAQTG